MQLESSPFTQSLPRADLERVRAAMEAQGLDAVLPFSVENVRYLTGHAPANPKLKGIFCALFCADPSLPPAFVVGQFEEHWARIRSRFDDVRTVQLWVEMDDLHDLETNRTTVVEKPVQFSREQTLAILRDLLDDRGLRGRRIGLERAMIPSALLAALEGEFTDIEFVDATHLFEDLRAIKTPGEVEALRRATQLAELGVRRIFLDADPRGKTVSQLRLEYQLAIMDAVRNDPATEGLEDMRVYISTGGGVGPIVSRNEIPVREGDVIWIDCGVQIDGLASDIGYTFSAGEPGPQTLRVADALAEGSQAGFELLRPGTSMGEVFRACEGTIRKHGLPTYTRGHHGHAVGIGIGEQAPYVTDGEERPLLPGMVMAFERPYYVRGLGGFQMEDNYVVTDDGIEIFNTLPTRLHTI
ncbi:M24 family metallopeptidase [Compostimonas suwonensis]|uniref:Xaa-Pro aminopeptidase n=1 Tax=Compostimonas suwonensis TaxID=1048394 RepID=A0A2M9C070_9MICO|nr:Xaa-Pro peptidase family protein [Compostimonas suwonensis]PJJ63736.1 Xaa-Pro aminopeptidase [Compostimonas suwonensis]